jgi:Mrp family chromosome partitioning ATPase
MAKNKVNAFSDQPLALSVPNYAGSASITYPGEVVDSLRQLTTRIISRQGKFPQRLSMVASLRREGLSVLSQALAATLAHDLEVRVCMVELNWWWPSAMTLSNTANPGLEGVLSGQSTLDEIICHTGWENLCYVTAGRIPKKERPVMARNPFLRQTILELSERFDHLILDIPAILATSDAVPLASLGTALCLVVSQGVTGVDDARLALDEVSHLPIVGVVMNRAKMATPAFIYQLLSGK